MAKQHLDDSHEMPGQPDPNALDSETYYRHRSCTGKHPFPTRAEAEAAIPRMIQQWHISEAVSELLNVYLCEHCHQFHIGRNHQRS